MKGKERREKIIQMLMESETPVAGKDLATFFHVSRQVIVQDIALLRANNYDIFSTNHGYIIQNAQKASRVFKVIHTDEQTEEEMNCIVDYGGIIEDVFVYHRIYGIVKADLKIHTRNEIQLFLKDIQSGKSSLLKNVTAGYHYHTVLAPTETVLDLIQEQLKKKGFLADLQDFEPVNFWPEESN